MRILDIRYESEVELWEMERQRLAENENATKSAEADALLRPNSVYLLYFNL